MKKRMIFYVVFFAYFLCISQSVSANFACGEVTSNDLNVPSWVNVLVSYSEKPFNTTNCKISPDNLRYCCDPLDIKEVSWQVGKTLNAKVFDLDNGYFSPTKSLTITGEGFDVFDTLESERGINIISPAVHAYLGTDSIYLNLTSASIFDRIYYNLSKEPIESSDLVCESCNSFEKNFEDIDYGVYNLKLTVGNSLVNYSESINVTLLEYADFSRIFECEDCTQERLGAGKYVNVSLSVNLSHYSYGKLVELVPKEFDVIGDVALEPYSESHNAIVWNTEGKDIAANYTLVLPNSFFSSEYVFRTSFEGIEDEEQEITVSRFWFLDLFSRLKRIAILNESLSEVKFFPRVTPSEPLVYDPIVDYIEEFAIFTQNNNKNAYLKFNDRFLPNELEDEIDGNYEIFSFATNLNYDKITNISMKFKLNDSDFKVPNFYFLSNRNFTKLHSVKYLNESGFSHYLVTGEEPGFYAVTEGDQNE